MKKLPRVCVCVLSVCAWVFVFMCVFMLNTLGVKVAMYSLTKHNVESIAVATVYRRGLARSSTQL